MTRVTGESGPSPSDGEVQQPRIQAENAGSLTWFLAQPSTFVVILVLSFMAMILVPAGWLVAVPACGAVALWQTTRRYRLPFRLPTADRMTDYSNPFPGSGRRFRKGEGLLFLGNDHSSNEELWITDSDARRHALILGTTGAGKALTDDTLVLTPKGWRPNGDLRPGDRVVRPCGGAATVLSIHPQGRIPVVRMEFADGRIIDCSRDHLWPVRVAGDDARGALRLMSAVDIAIMLEVSPGGLQDRVQFRLPAVSGITGFATHTDLTRRNSLRAGRDGLGAAPLTAASAGAAVHRHRWCCQMLRERHRQHGIRRIGVMLKVPILDDADGYHLRQLVWSLGGTAMQVVADGHLFALVRFPGQGKVFGETATGREESLPGIEIFGAEAFPSFAEAAAPAWRDGGGHARNSPLEAEMTCIRTDAPDGLFVTENYIVTHNTELLLGIASQSLMWGSGFMFIDGKGTGEFHARVWSLISRFGRQDDYRILNFTDSGVHPDDPAGGPDIQSNTLNPFSRGSADQLMNLIVSLMGESGNAGDMWKGRAMSLVTSTMKALCEMRDAGDVLLDVQSIRDFLPLGIGIPKEFLEGREISDVSEVPEVAWKDMRSRGGMIELYLRALNGEFSNRSRLALKGFFESLPGFDLKAALNGDPQEGKAVEQYGFLAMQLTRPLGSLADDFGHLFRTPFGEVDMEDVVLNRRILVVLLPALQKAPAEMRNCGRIVVSMLKIMMGRAAGSALEGSKQSLVDSRPTRSDSPFIVILDEAGYYMIKGIDTMMAQARSLGFMIIISGQDMASMQSVSPQIAETVAANARLTGAGATEDAQRTWRFLQQKFDRHTVAVASGGVRRTGLSGAGWVERPDVTFAERERVRISDLQKLREGEFYFLMESRLVKSRVFHVGDDWSSWISMNKFLVVRGPTDCAPGLDQSVDTEFIDSLEAIGQTLIDVEELERRLQNYPFDPHDALHCAMRFAQETSSRTGKPDVPPTDPTDATLLGIMFGSRLAIGR